jgi:O-antigen/teichoic acid export membrane protein
VHPFLDTIRTIFISKKNNPSLKTDINPSGQAAFLVGSNLIANVLSYLFLLSMARLLPADSFASMQSLFSVLMIGMMAGLPLRLAIAKSFGSGELDSRQIQSLVASKLYRFRFVILGGLFFCWLLSKPISHFLGVSSDTAVFFVLLCLILDLCLQCLSAVLQGAFQFKSLGYLTIVNPLFKLVFSILLIYLSLSTINSVSGKIWVSIPAIGILLSTFLTVTIGFLLVRRLPSRRPSNTFQLDAPKPNEALHFQKMHLEDRLQYPERLQKGFQILNFDTLLLTILHISFSFISQIDIIVANKFLPINDRGSVAIMSIVGRVLLYSIGAISPIVFSYRSRGRSSSILKPTLIFTLACGLGGAAMALLAGQRIMSLVFGDQYVIDSWLLALWILMYMILSYLMILIMEISATKLKKEILIIPGTVAIMLTYLALFTTKASDILAVISIGGLALIVFIHWQFKLSKATSKD